MLRILSITPLVMGTLVAAQTGDTLAPHGLLNDSLTHRIDDSKEVEVEFKSIYKDYCHKINHKIRYGNFLDTIVMIQLNYLTKFENDSLTHYQHDVPKYRTVGHRIFSVYEVHRGDYSEIAIIGKFNGNYSVKEKAELLFNSFMKSPGHRKAMINRTFKYFSFKLKYKPNGVLVGVGVFSEMWGNE
jgi:hypothetical protein